MSDGLRFSARDIGRVLDEIRTRIDRERRAKFKTFGVSLDCHWPASRVFHEHSSLGPAWTPLLGADEIEEHTKNLDYKKYVGARRTVLPHPTQLSASLEQTIRSRRSQYDFSDQPITITELAKLLELGSGVTRMDEIPRRAAPSGGALYPVETYALVLRVDGLNPGLYHYVATDHVLETVRHVGGIDVTKSFLPPRLFHARPQLILVLSIVFARTQLKYLERGYRFALLEAGHIAQNFVLTATALDLSSVCVGGFWDEPFNEFLGIEPTHEAVIYTVLVGRRANEEADAGSTLEQ